MHKKKTDLPPIAPPPLLASIMIGTKKNVNYWTHHIAMRSSTRHGDTFDERLARGLRLRFPDYLGDIGDATAVVRTVQEALRNGDAAAAPVRARAEAEPKATTSSRSSAKTQKRAQPTKTVSKELQKIVGVSEISRGDATKAIWAYAKSHQLNRGKLITVDSVLRGVFGDRATIDGFKDMQKLLTPHLT